MLNNTCGQDCVCLIAPYPYNPDPPEDFNRTRDMDISGEGLMWFARPQLFFKCTLCPTGMKARKQRHMEVSLVFFSTFEPINITPRSIMQRNGVPMFYDTASSSGIEPSLYLCPAGNVLGRVPMLPCFVAGNKHPTLPHSIGSRQGAVADTRPDAGNGSRLYELSPWMWRYGRGQPRKVSVADAEARRRERMSEARRQAAETVKRQRDQRGDDYAARQRSRGAGGAGAQ